MIKEDLKSYKVQTGYNLAQLEIDYLQNVFLQIIYSKFNTLYFKGGTCLQKCYGLKRFSEDLYFNYKKINPKDVIIFLQKNSPYDFEIKEINENNFGSTIRISVKGVLYDGQDSTKCKISFDFRKNDTYLQTKTVNITPKYKDILSYTIVSLSKEEIVAEKIRAIITRNKARDIFDLYFLLKEKISVDKKLVDTKLQTYNLSYSDVLFKEKVLEKKKIYTKEIQSLVQTFPTFEECAELILK